MAKAVNLSDLLKIDLPAPTIEVQKPNTGSITPTTHDGRKTFDFSPLPQGTANSHDLVTGEEFFVDRFKYDEGKTEHEVMRYGINTSTIKVNPGQVHDEAMALGEVIRVNSGGKSVAGQSQKKSAVSSASKNKQAKAESVTHHNVEKVVFKNAVSHLLDNANKKTVLAHIFERDDESSIKLEGGFIKTHTVLLYKNPEAGGKHEILVIDPNNFDFSMHLGNKEMHTLMSSHGKFGSISVSGKGTQLYKAMGPQGRNPDQYRDCADIAVKLAFGFSFGFNLDPRLDMKTILDCPVVQALSNNSDINEYVPDDSVANRVIKHPFRTQHKSNVKVGKKFYDCSKAIENNIDILSDRNPEKQKLKQTHAKIISADQNNDTTLSSILALTEESFDVVCNELHVNKGLLMGDVPDFD